MNDSSEWKPQLIVVLQFIFSFYIATFCFGLYLLNVQPLFDAWGCFLFLCYGLVLFINLVRLIQCLSLPAIMFASPTLPLVALISVVSMFPIWQWFQLH